MCISVNLPSYFFLHFFLLIEFQGKLFFSLSLRKKHDHFLLVECAGIYVRIYGKSRLSKHSLTAITQSNITDQLVFDVLNAQR
jgi:hypothetical protein